MTDPTYVEIAYFVDDENTLSPKPIKVGSKLIDSEGYTWKI
ncbi:MAG TPA: hypothetical protein PKY54_05905 [Chitinophagales bacterium]|nr:hypothetical protein [Chitinophagales bacterium]